MYQPPCVALLVVPLPCRRHSLLAVDGPRDHALVASDVRRVSPAAAPDRSRVKNVEGATGVDVTTPHLDLRLPEGRAISAIG